MRKNYQCVKRFMAGLLCAAFIVGVMTACGNTTDAEGSVITVSGDGTVTDTIREPFDQDYYSQQELQDEFQQKGVKIVQTLHKTDYNNLEFTIEDIDGRWICLGIKQS